MGEWGCRLTREHGIDTESLVQETQSLLDTFGSCDSRAIRTAGGQLLLSVNRIGAALNLVQTSQEAEATAG